MKITAHTDPLKYANRPMERSFDEYASLYAHIRKLVAGKPEAKKSALDAK